MQSREAVFAGRAGPDWNRSERDKSEDSQSGPATLENYHGVAESDTSLSKPGECGPGQTRSGESGSGWPEPEQTDQDSSIGARQTRPDLVRMRLNHPYETDTNNSGITSLNIRSGTREGDDQQTEGVVHWLAGVIAAGAEKGEDLV